MSRGPCCPGETFEIPRVFYGRIGGMTTHVSLKNTVSGVVAEFTARDAERYLKLYPNILVVVDKPKNEVLSAPYKQENGERVRLVEPVVDTAPLATEDTPAKTKKDK